MRRRRQKNPLLMRILGISLLLHILLLPVLAHYGAFKKIQQQFVEARMVVMPAPEQEKPKAEVKKEQKAAKKIAPAAKKSAATTPHQHQAAQKSNLNQPKVVASAASGGTGDDGGATVDANGTGKAGELPTQKADTTPPTVKQEETTPPVVVKKPDPPKIDTPKIVKNETPEPKTTAPPEVKPVVKKDPVYSEAEAIDTPQPTLPDDLRADDLHATFVAEFVVGTDGKPSEIKVAQSTGNNTLDKLALETAHRWKFKPATRDGQPIESRVRLHIEFQVTE